jgi:hypothetical protein
LNSIWHLSEGFRGGAGEQWQGGFRPIDGFSAVGLKAGILEDDEVYPNEEGTPEGGSISVMLSNVYLHCVLDLWFERVVKPRLRGEAHMIRYIDDFVMCFQYREDALRVQDALCKRLGKFGLTLDRPRPSSSNLAGSRNNMPPNTAGSAQRRSTFWGSRSTARGT